MIHLQLRKDELYHKHKLRSLSDALISHWLVKGLYHELLDLDLSQIHRRVTAHKTSANGGNTISDKHTQKTLLRHKADWNHNHDTNCTGISRIQDFEKNYAHTQWKDLPDTYICNRKLCPHPPLSNHPTWHILQLPSHQTHQNPEQSHRF